MNIELAKMAIGHKYDGPIDIFVLISRTTKLTFEGKCKPDVAANALYETMKEYGFLDNERLIETGT